MPFSGPFCDDIVRHFLNEAPDLPRCLDIGAGNGKYGRLIRQYQPLSHITGLEVEADYVDRFDLHDVYDEVRVSDALDLLNDPDTQWDFVMLGDVIEHLPKSQGVDLVHFLVYRASYIMVIWPDEMLQNSWEGYRREAHVSSWTVTDFMWRDSFLFYAREHKRLIILDGYPPHTSAHVFMGGITSLTPR